MINSTRRIAASFKKSVGLLVLLALAACSQGGEKRCVAGGCSNQLCIEEGTNMASTCEWSDSYRCYQTVGTCERQTDGKCGWTPTEALSQCLSKTNSRPPFLPSSAP